MKKRHSIACAALSGVLLCVSFPTVIFGARLPEMGWLAWIALAPLFVAIRKATPRKAFSLAFVSGLIFYGGSVYWVYSAMNTFGGLSPTVSLLVLLLMVVILAAYTGLAPLLARFIASRWRGEFIAVLPACWVAVDLLRNYGPVGGFPWSNVAMSQWRMIPMIQIADAVGVYGITFLVVWVNACIAEAVARLTGEQVRQLALKAAITVALVAISLGYGLWRMSAIGSSMADAGVVKAGLVQPDISQEEKWKGGKAEANLNVLRRATRTLRDAAVDFIVWPEAAFPWPIEEGAEAIDPKALGLDDSEFGDLPFVMLGALTERADGEYHNSAWTFDAKGRSMGAYHKAHLVPFGEYVPYEKLLFFAEKLTEPVGRFKAGAGFEPVAAGQMRIGPLICYEDIFPQIARELTRRGANVLVNLTNDAWYGVSSAPYQHAALSVFRAVENRRFLVRATNTGVSALITPVGRMEYETGLFEPALIVAPVGLRSEISLYTRLGDWFAYACAAYALIGLAAAGLAWARGRWPAGYNGS